MKIEADSDRHRQQPEDGGHRSQHDRAKTHPSVSGLSGAHIDLSYFGPLYKSEIKTPIYPLVKQSLALLRQSGWKSFAATISCSGIDGGPLDSRLLADDLADPSVKYGLYRVFGQFKAGDKTLQYLAEASALDTVYAFEYLVPTDLATEKMLPYDAFRMLRLAAASLLENPFISLRLAETSASRRKPKRSSKGYGTLPGRRSTIR